LCHIRDLKKNKEFIELRYYFRGIKPWIEEKLNECSCKFTAPPPKMPRPPLRQPPIPDTPFERIGIDFIGPFAESKNGNKYILTAICHLTGYPYAKAVPSKDADGVVNFLQEICNKHGVSDVIILDNEKSFCSNVMKVLEETFGTELRFSSVSSCFLLLLLCLALPSTD
jgi:hypothetical protein